MEPAPDLGSLEGSQVLLHDNRPFGISNIGHASLNTDTISRNFKTNIFKNLLQLNKY